MAAQDKVTFKQDLTEPVKIRHYEGVVFTGDDCGNLIKVALFDGGAPYSDGGTVSATAVLADGTTFPLTQGSITGNMVSVPLEAGALVVSGPMGLYVKISGNGIICTVLNAIFTVQVTDTGRVPAATVTTVNELVQEIKDAQDSFPADLTNLLAAVAPTFSTSTAYSAGAYVWQGGKLYRFTAAHPAGTWTGTDAVTVALGDDVADLKSASCQNYVVLSETQINPSGNTTYDNLNGDGEYDFQYYAKVKNGGSGDGYFTVLWYQGSAELKRETVLISNGAFYEFTISKGTTFTKIVVTNTNSLSNCTIYVYGDSNKKLIDYAKENMLSTLSLVSKTAFLPVLRNGTVGNSSNANGVATDKIYPFGDAKYVKVEINKDKQVSGNQYQIVYTTYSVDNGVTDVASQANRITSDAYLQKSDTGIFSNADGSVGFAFAIFEWTSGGAPDPVRKTDFTDDDIVITYIYERKTIEIGAGKDFEKFSDGLAEAYRLGNCDVIVYPGTYNLVTELGESGLANNTNYKGLYIGRNTLLTFMDGAKVTCHYTGSVNTIITWFAILRAMDGNYIVENADFDCSNIRYCVHDEKDGIGDYIHEYIDCRMKIDNTGSSWGPHQCIGGGFGTHGIVKVIRGVYESVGIGNRDNGVVTFHQPASQDVTEFENTFIVDGVYFVNGTAFYSCGGASTIMSDFICTGCSMLVAPFINGAGTSATQNVNGYIWGNEIRN